MAASESGVINFTDLTLTLIYRCNYRCPHCLVGELLQSKHAISYEEAIEIIDSAAELGTFGSVAFVGGEPFLVYPLMLRISEYIHQNYGLVPLTASTNSYWAKDVDNARSKIEPLAKLGLQSLLLSWDDFHAKFGKISQLANAVTVCNEFEVKPTIQNIIINNSSRIGEIKEKLDELCDTSNVEWAENICTPVGLGEQFKEEDQTFISIDDIPFGECTAGKILNVEADGDVKPCCGSGLMASGLTMGNIRQKSVEAIVRKSSVDPLFNSLVANQGPKHLVEMLRVAGRTDLIPKKVTGVCDACYKITNNPEAVSVLKEKLKTKQVEIMLSRAASETFSSLPTLGKAEGFQGSVFEDVPNYDQAEHIQELNLDSASAKTFQQKFLYRHEPVLINGSFSNDIPAFKKWADINYLKEKAGDTSIRATIGMFSYDDNIIELSFRRYLDRITRESFGERDRGIFMDQHEVPAPLNEDLGLLFELLASLTGGAGMLSAGRDILLRKVDPPRMYCFVGRHTYTDCHEHGGHEAFLIQLTGSKEVLLHRPTERNFRALYAGKRGYENWSPVRLHQPDLVTFPRLVENQPSRTVVNAGEMLYIPDGWFHSVSSIGDDLSFTLTYFFPAVFVDLMAAPRWEEFKDILRSGSFSERIRAWMRIMGEYNTLKSYIRRVFRQQHGSPLPA